MTSTNQISDLSVHTYQYTPNKRGPLLVIVPSIFGLSPDVIQYAKTFANAGALVYVIDPFWRVHSGPLTIPQDAQAGIQRMKDTNPKDVLDDLLLAIDYGLQQPLCNGALIVLGICFGGRFALQVAQERKVQGAGIWHGAHTLEYLDLTSLSSTHLTMDFGAEDPLIPLDEVDEIKKKLQVLENHDQEKNQVIMRSLRVHAGASHGFTHVGTVKGQPEAAKLAESSMIEMIKKINTTESI